MAGEDCNRVRAVGVRVRCRRVGAARGGRPEVEPEQERWRRTSLAGWLASISAPPEETTFFANSSLMFPGGPSPRGDV